jgi:hypothetical protein
MKLEFHSGAMVAFYFSQPWELAGQLSEPGGALATAPPILAVNGQENIAKRQLRLGQIAADEVGVFRRKCGAVQSLLDKEQTGGAIHQQAGGFR